MADLDQAIRLYPEGAQAFHARGLIHQRQNEQALAITDFDNAIDRDPFAAAPYQARAQSLFATGKYAGSDRGLQRRAERRHQECGRLGRPWAFATRRPAICEGA